MAQRSAHKNQNQESNLYSYLYNESPDMDSSPRIVFNYVELTNQTGLPLFILPDQICTMTISKAVVSKGTPQEKEIQVTEIKNEYGIAEVVFESPKQICERIGKATNACIKNLQAQLSSSVIQAPAGLAVR